MFCITTNIYIFVGIFFHLLLGISHTNLLQEICQKKLTQQFCTQRKNIKQNVKFGSHIFYPFPTRNTSKSLTTYNVCNNTEINIKKDVTQNKCTTSASFQSFSFLLSKEMLFSSKQAIIVAEFPINMTRVIYYKNDTTVQTNSTKNINHIKKQKLYTHLMKMFKCTKSFQEILYFNDNLSHLAKKN